MTPWVPYTTFPHDDRCPCGGLWVGGKCVRCESECGCKPCTDFRALPEFLRVTYPHYMPNSTTLVFRNADGRLVYVVEGNILGIEDAGCVRRENEWAPVSHLILCQEGKVEVLGKAERLAEIVL